MDNRELIDALNRIANALESKNEISKPVYDFEHFNTFVWNGDDLCMRPVSKMSYINLDMLQGIDLQKRILLQNTQQFAEGFSANNALIWGARGTGKSSIIKAIHHHITEELKLPLTLVEIYREDLETLSALLSQLRDVDRQFILYCDDLSFDENDHSYKSLKAVLEGGIESRPTNVIFYATSNRRHLMPRDMIENESSTAINPNEAIEEKVSLSDRFGLWLGFHSMDQKTYLNIIANYIEFYGLDITEEAWKPKALEWSVTRGSRSGRVAWQFFNDLAGFYKFKIE